MISRSIFGLSLAIVAICSRSPDDSERVRRLRSEFGLYIVDSGRICVAALNDVNLDYVTDAIASVL